MRDKKENFSKSKISQNLGLIYCRFLFVIGLAFWRSFCGEICSVCGNGPAYTFPKLMVYGIY